MSIYFRLFWVFFQIGLFSFGGGLASLPFIQSLVVEDNAWLSTANFSDLVTLAQMTPGPIGINAATYVGVKIGGIGTALMTTSASVLAPFCCTYLIAYLYQKHHKLNFLQSIFRTLRPASVSLMIKAVMLLTIITFYHSSENTLTFIYPKVKAYFLFKNIDMLSLLFLILSVFLKKKYKLSILKLMAIIGFFYTTFIYVLNFLIE